MMYNIKKRVKMKKRKLPMTNVALFGSQSQGSQKVQCFTENLVHETLHFLGPHCITNDYVQLISSGLL